ncbi:hypothetical protein GN956_G21034 [Arapaima gigas]
MTQNMFQEGLYHVFFSEHPPPRAHPANMNTEDLKEARIVRWFGAVVNTRLLVTGVVQVLSSLSSVLANVSFVCVNLGCSMSTTAPVWCGILYIATGGHAICMQRKPSKVKVVTLMGLNVFCLLLATFSFISYGLHLGIKPSPLSREQVLSPSCDYSLTADSAPLQTVGAHVAQGAAIFFMVQCVLASFYTLFLSWRGLGLYRPSYRQAYHPVSQVRCSFFSGVSHTAG